jgi:hypothetical protein
MNCPKCGSDDVKISLTANKGKTKTHKNNIFYLLIRWTLVLCTCGLWLVVPKRKSTSKTKYIKNKTAICQQCGYSWDVK